MQRYGRELLLLRRQYEKSKCAMGRKQQGQPSEQSSEVYNQDRVLDSNSVDNSKKQKKKKIREEETDDDSAAMVTKTLNTQIGARRSTNETTDMT